MTRNQVLISANADIDLLHSESNQDLKKGILVALTLALLLIWSPMPNMGNNLIVDAEAKPQPRRRAVIRPKVAEPVQRQQLQQRQAQRRPMPDRTPNMPEPVVAPQAIAVPEFNDLSTEWDFDAPDAPPHVDEILTADAVGLEMPVITKRIRPNYPKRALQVGIQGYVILEAVMRRDGRMTDIKVVRQLGRGKFGFEDEARNALANWEFVPGQVQGRTVDVRMHFTVHFTTQR